MCGSSTEGKWLVLELFTAPRQPTTPICSVHESTHRNFLDALLQQFNFNTHTTDAPVEASAEATTMEEPAEDAVAEPQAEEESENTESSDQPEE